MDLSKVADDLETVFVNEPAARASHLGELVILEAHLDIV
jgi:hypothetical protein